MDSDLYGVYNILQEGMIQIKKIIFLLFSFPVLACAQRSVSYFPNGNKRVEGILKDSVRFGVWQTWYENNQLSDSGEYVLLEKGQLFFRFSDVGYLADTAAIIANWINKTSIEKGKWIRYYKNGKIMEDGEYLPICVLKIDFVENGDGSVVYSFPQKPSGKKTGLWKYYDESGKLYAEETYDKAGKLIEQKNH